MSVMLSIRLPESLAKELEEISAFLDRSKSYIVKKALEEYLEEYADYLISIERLRDKDDRIISSEELREALDL